MHPTRLRTFHVYGRKSHPEPLAFVGQLKIEDPSDLKGEALNRFGETGWVELIAFSEATIVPVIPVSGQRGIQ